MAGITAAGAYIPRLRLQRAAIAAAHGWADGGAPAAIAGERAMAGWDEDAITMGVEAARDALAGQSPDGFSALTFATTTAPFEARLNAGLIAEALRLGSAIRAIDVTTSQRAGTSALLAAFDSPGRSLVVAADRRHTPAGSPQELQYGDGAAALVVGADDGLARFLGGLSRTVDFIDHYRGEGREFDYHWETRWVRDEGYLRIVPPAIADLLAQAGVAASAIDHFCMPCTLPRVAAEIARHCGLPAASLRPTLDGACGETGAAHPLLMLVHTLQEAKPGQRILVVGFGQGADALLFETTAAALPAERGVLGALRRRQPEASYGRFLALNDLVKVDRGMRAEADKQSPPSAIFRNRHMLHALVGGRCTACGTLQFPRSNVCVNPNCRAHHSQVDQPFADFSGRIRTWSADYLTYTPDPPNHFGLVEFAEGGRMMVDFTDVAPGEIAIGTPVRMVFRIKDHDRQRGFTRYFWKATPAI